MTRLRRSILFPQLVMLATSITVASAAHLHQEQSEGQREVPSFQTERVVGRALLVVGPADNEPSPTGLIITGENKAPGGGVVVTAKSPDLTPAESSKIYSNNY